MSHFQVTKSNTHSNMLQVRFYWEMHSMDFFSAYTDNHLLFMDDTDKIINNFRISVWKGSPEPVYAHLSVTKALTDDLIA